MKNEIKSYKMTIFDSQYTLVSDEHEARIIKSAHYVDTIMKEIAEKSRLHDVQKIAVLAALKIVHCMFDLQDELENSKQIEHSLVKRIEQEIENLALL